MTKRNNSVEFFRFLFCCAICLHHFRDYGDGSVFRSGYLGVDVFFVLSGFFLMNHFVTRETGEMVSPERSALRYLRDRLIRLGPHHVFSWIIMAFIVVFVLKTRSASDVLLYGCWEFLLLKATALGNNITVNGVVWYLSALVICSYIIYWFLCWERKRGNGEGEPYTHVIAPVLFFVVMGWLWSQRDDLNYWIQSAPVFTGGFLRGISEMGLGCTAYAVVRAIRSHYTPGRGANSLATVFEVLGWAFVFYHMYKQRDPRDFIVPALSAALVVSTFAFRSYLTRLLDNSFSAFLGKMSYPMYLNQFMFIRPILKLMPGLPFWPVASCMMAALFVFSLFSNWLVQKATRWVQAKAAKI